MEDIMGECLVSIIVPYYNSDLALVKRAIDSALNQSYNNVEIIICDDGSEQIFKTGLLEIVSNYTHRVYLVAHSENQGISCARNTAVENSNGKWLVWLDADDTLDVHCVNHLIESTQDVAMVIGESYVHEDGNCVIRKPKLYYDLAKKHLGTTYDPFMLNVISLQPQIVAKKAFLEAGRFNPTYSMAEMTEFYLRFLLCHGLDNIRFITNAKYNYNRNLDNTISSNRDKLFLYRKMALDFYRAEHGINVDDIKYIGRSDNTGMQSYLPIRNGKLLIPSYFKYIENSILIGE